MLLFDDSISYVEISKIYECVKGECVYNQSHVSSIDKRLIGDNGKIGPITSKIQKLYYDIVKGKVEKYKHWCTPIYD